MTDDRQAWIIKLAAVVTATPRWVAALLAAEGLAVPAAWTWWLGMSALFSAGMALVEGLAFAYVFSAWRNQTDRRANNLLWLTLISAAIFIAVLSPYIAASVAGVRLAEILSTRLALLGWSAAVAASTIAIVVSVGYAQRAVKTNDAGSEIATLRSHLRQAEDRAKSTEAQAKSAEAEAKSAEVRANVTEERAKSAEDRAKSAEDRAKSAEMRANSAEERFAAAGDLLARLFAGEKRQRILAARSQWPALPPSALAIIADASQGYVSDVLRELEPVE